MRDPMQVQKGTAIYKFAANDAESAEPGTSPQGPRPFVTASIDGVEAPGDLYLTIAGQFAAAARGRPVVRRCRRCRPYFFEFSCRVASEAPLELTGAAARRRAGVGAYKFLRPKKNNFGPHRGCTAWTPAHSDALKRTMSDAVRPPYRARAMHHHQRSMRAPLEVAPIAALLLILKLAFDAQTCLRRARRLT